MTLPPRAYQSPSAWSSLLGDLGADPAPGDPRWQIHDRTNLEYSAEYRVPPGLGSASYEWEAYYFLPRSFRLSSETYRARDIYTDLRSYVRYAVPRRSLHELEACVERLRAKAIAAPGAAGEERTLHELRFFACLFRGSCMREKKALLRIYAARSKPTTSKEAPPDALEALVVGLESLLRCFRALLEEVESQPLDEEQRAAWRWVDEDLSRLAETLLAHLHSRLRGRLQRSSAGKVAAERLREAAVAEARYRKEQGMEGVGEKGISKREVEHIDFRRRVLKRFTSAILWLRPEVRPSHTLALEILYAFAASVAMAFALIAALWNGPQAGRGELWLWGSVVVLAYAAKDRIKASLQKLFDRTIKRRLPDRRWRYRVSSQGPVVAQVDERSGFLTFEQLPPLVLGLRRSTRSHAIEEEARPEDVLWHKKEVSLFAGPLREADDRIEAITEIFRLNLRRWLLHTSDPKQKILFADPESGKICSAVAPHVYNIGVVFRVRRKGDEEAAWNRVRVVVTRKGIQRVEKIL